MDCQHRNKCAQKIGRPLWMFPNNVNMPIWSFNRKLGLVAN